jgi:hypothetical protein
MTLHRTDQDSKGSPMSPDRPLLHHIERFLRETGIPATRFGRDAVNDPRLVLDLRNGREPGTRMRCRIEHFMNTYRSNGLLERAAA